MHLDKRRLFLSSNSVYKSMNYLEHTIKEMVEFLGDVSKIVFIPFAAVAEKENWVKVKMITGEKGWVAKSWLKEK